MLYGINLGPMMIRDRLSQCGDRYACFDAAELAKDQYPFFYDISSLYALRGYRFSGLCDLAKQVLGESSIQDYSHYLGRLKAQARSYVASGIDIGNYSIEELVPPFIVDGFWLERSLLLQRLFDSFRHEKRILEFYSEHFFWTIQCLMEAGHNSGIKFNFVGTKHGRLTCKKSDFNVYTGRKEERNRIQARSDHTIVQLDLVASQPTIAVLLTEDEHLKRMMLRYQDIYSIFEGTRDYNKIAFLRWMFGNVADEQYDRICEPIKSLRQSVFHQAKKNGYLETIFGRPLYFNGTETENVVFQYYITATEADFLFGIMVSLVERFKCHGIKLLFPFHDALVLEIPNEKMGILPEMRIFMEEFYLYHTFNESVQVKVKLGPNFGEMSDYGI